MVSVLVRRSDSVQVDLGALTCHLSVIFRVVRM